METYEALATRRSIRRFKEKPVEREALKKCIEAARLSPSAANLQPLRFISTTEDLGDIFQHTGWAGYLDWEPGEDEMPRAYIAIVKERDRGWDTDIGLAAQSICLAAHDQGLGSCLLGSIDREVLEEMLPVPEGFDLKLMVGMGYPDEEAETVEAEGDIEYYYKDGVLKVPKRPLKEIWIER